MSVVAIEWEEGVSCKVVGGMKTTYTKMNPTCAPWFKYRVAGAAKAVLDSLNESVVVVVGEMGRIHGDGGAGNKTMHTGTVNMVLAVSSSTPSAVYTAVRDLGVVERCRRWLEVRWSCRGGAVVLPEERAWGGSGVVDVIHRVILRRWLEPWKELKETRQLQQKKD
ncbi:hypothetical protein IW261DRAFT_1110583 [Armillaria novae-zelandiae]|uniref:Uncharacterized protein n=1 Tax=Armillaria novae-zelandiae TaxID=153914 RepID=A0AA39TQ65_9AGAR|nr:hypothetical protein IW261DRAFT_1110583 [Armillaria novae-zelandiae]